MLNIVLIEPEIPPNTGNVGRTCAALDATLHLVGPLGFSLSEKSLKRAGLDYWSSVKVIEHPSLEDFLRILPKRMVFTTAFAEKSYTEIAYQKDDFILFGRETKGLPSSLYLDYPETTVRIPHWGQVRSLNLAVAVGIVAYEAVRQLSERGEIPPPVPRAPDYR
ncbi:MAG TPA: tRNA (uridine(34)/cytosine(34)/5-carboxymethylaminomethyluridine(34)-2'-O)-methyltransferase TrmL [Cyanobacteria bacterium UBA8530]|nr:tRNA (uridine(34)/cytosine(34)/5-carboxymethylaminomethyluridine(34)-2'-O)-methyltransferase TrmL [Cyanobacteria bacterium UBA8530]